MTGEQHYRLAERWAVIAKEEHGRATVETDAQFAAARGQLAAVAAQIAEAHAALALAAATYRKPAGA